MKKLDEARWLLSYSHQLTAKSAKRANSSSSIRPNLVPLCVKSGFSASWSVRWRFRTRSITPTTRAPRPSTSPAAIRKPTSYPDEATDKLNAAIHVAAVTQARDPGPGRDHYRRKIAEHKTTKEARRSLKRRISNAIYRRILADHQRLQL